jgi:peptide/nickel transport system substrate-binding protein
MEPLLHVDSNGVVTPWLAESYKIADDLKSITFTLRKDVKFHDGTDFNAQAAKWNLENTIESKSQPTWASVDIVDDYTVRLNLNYWNNTIINGLANASSWMVSPTAFQKNGADWSRDNPVGTGPFKFVSYQRDVSYKATKNPDYWIKGKPYLDGVEILYIADPMTQKSVMQSGGADCSQVEAGKIASDLKAQGFELAISVNSTFCMLPDTAHSNSPFANQKVREAVEHAINREAIAKAFSYGFWTAPYQIPAPASGAYNPDFTLGRKYDLAKAKQLMAEAGYPNGFNATLLVLPVGIDKNIPLAIQDDLKQININLEVSIPAIIPKYLEDSNTLNNCLVLQPVFGAANWNGALSLAFRPGMTNQNQVWERTPEFIELYNTTLSSAQPDVKLMRAVSDYLTKNAEVIPVFNGGSAYAYASYVMDGGWYGRASDLKPEDIWLNK